MIERSETSQLRGDAALAPDALDAIGLREAAARLAEALADLRTDASLVIGIEGRWGSGKSSLLSEIEQAFARLCPARSHSLVHFRPWLVGNRDALLGQLFADLDHAIANVEVTRGDTTRVTLARAKRASKAARKFAAGLARAGSTVEIIGDVSSFAPAKWGGKVLTTVGGWLGREPDAKSLDVLRTRLIAALKALDRRIIVTIDDIDRLEPAEMLEVLRLVRSVGDLPGVLYLLCYDSAILAHGIKQAAAVKDGQAYLEKIIQLTVKVPLPETFTLRHWFEVSLAEFATPHSGEAAERLKIVIDIEGGRRLNTPRAVVRVLDSLRFLWPTLVKVGADLADLVWLQLIKDADPGLYRWIEQYCATASELALGTASVSDEERAVTLDELIAFGGQSGFGSLHHRHYFATQLLGLELNYSKDGPPFQLFANVSERERDAAIGGRRLASPDHYRLYFALTDPTHALKQVDFDAFWAAALDGSDAVSQLLISMQNRPSSRVLTQTDILLERIRGRDPATLRSEQCANILIGFADGLDNIYRAKPFSIYGVTSPWDRAARLIIPFLAQLNVEQRAATIQRMFAGAALSWLTSLLRRETFAHGRAGTRPKPDSERYLRTTEFDTVATIMLTRYNDMSLDTILDTISPIDVLFAWIQCSSASEAEHVRSFVNEQTADATRFLRLLDALRSTITTSEARYKALKPDNVEPFFAFEAVEARLEKLAEDRMHPEIAAHAKLIIDSIATAREF